MPKCLLLLLLATSNTTLAATSPTVSPTTTNNDDSCDIGVAPAATLLLPYFQVDLSGDAATGRTTVFSVVNVSAFPQIARVTLWTDWSYPALTFNLFLTGYDVKGIDLRELLVRGTVPTRVVPPGRMSNPNFSNPNHRLPATEECGARVPHIPPALLDDVRALLSSGRVFGATLSCPSTSAEDPSVGSDHGLSMAAGYVTIDVVANCASTLPTSSKYFTAELLFDNVLIGDYTSIEPSGSSNGFAGGSPLVHIRAVPEGGAPGSIVATRLPYTFYDRFTDINAGIPRTIDRRQPLPSAFAARWIDGGPTGFATTYSMWREALTGPRAACTEYASNGNIPVAELVRFDERENAAVLGDVISVTNAPRGFSASSVVAPYSRMFPTLYTTDYGGWAYLNLNNGGAADATYSASRSGFGSADAKGNWYPRNVSQNWVVINMFAEDRYGVSFDAAWLGNGCSPAMAQTSGGASGRIGAAANINP